MQHTGAGGKKRGRAAAGKGEREEEGEPRKNLRVCRRETTTTTTGLLTPTLRPLFFFFFRSCNREGICARARETYERKRSVDARENARDYIKRAGCSLFYSSVTLSPVTTIPHIPQRPLPHSDWAGNAARWWGRNSDRLVPGIGRARPPSVVSASPRAREVLIGGTLAASAWPSVGAAGWGSEARTIASASRDRRRAIPRLPDDDDDDDSAARRLSRLFPSFFLSPSALRPATLPLALSHALSIVRLRFSSVLLASIFETAYSFALSLSLSSSFRYRASLALSLYLSCFIVGTIRLLLRALPLPLLNVCYACLCRTNCRPPLAHTTFATSSRASRNSVR